MFFAKIPFIISKSVTIPSLNLYQYISNKFNISKESLFSVVDDVLYDFTTNTEVSLHGLAYKDLTNPTKALTRHIDEAKMTTIASMGWENVTVKHRKDPPPPSDVENSGFDVTSDFLSNFKTVPCKKKAFHDHRKCDCYHSPKDFRRNPFEIIYNENEVTGVEKACHAFGARLPARY